MFAIVFFEAIDISLDVAGCPIVLSAFKHSSWLIVIPPSVLYSSVVTLHWLSERLAAASPDKKGKGDLGCLLLANDAAGVWVFRTLYTESGI